MFSYFVFSVVKSAYAFSFRGTSLHSGRFFPNPEEPGRNRTGPSTYRAGDFAGACPVACGAVFGRSIQTQLDARKDVARGEGDDRDTGESQKLPSLREERGGRRPGWFSHRFGLAEDQGLRR